MVPRMPAPHARFQAATGPVVLQVLPALQTGGVERGTCDMAAALMDAGWRAIVASAGGPMTRELERVGALHLTLPLNSKNPFVVWRNAARLAEICARWRVDIVHARSRAPAWSALRATRRAGIPFVTTFHGTYNAGNALKRRYNAVMTAGDRMIAISDFIADHVRAEYDCPPERIRVIPRGVDIRSFDPDAVKPERIIRLSREWRLADGAPVIMLPGRLTRWKGQVDFIRLVARLVADGLPVHGLLAGGPHPRKRAYERELQKLVAQLELEPAVSFLGNRSDLREVLSVSACAFSLTGEPEAFGRTTIEALSLGIPVIGYEHGGTGEILRNIFPDGLVPLGDVEAAAARCAEFLRQRPPVPVIHPYTVERMQAATLAVYAELAGSPRAGDQRA